LTGSKKEEEKGSSEVAFREWKGKGREEGMRRKLQGAHSISTKGGKVDPIDGIDTHCGRRRRKKRNSISTSAYAEKNTPRDAEDK